MRTFFLLAGLLSLAVRPSAAQLADTKVLTQDAVQAMLTAAADHAKQNGWAVSISIVDANGDLLAFRRLDGASLLSIDVSQGKARTAARSGRPTKALADAIAAGRTVLLAVPGITPLQGGLPVLAGTRAIGGVGVSGVTSEQDEQVAQAGIAALKP